MQLIDPYKMERFGDMLMSVVEIIPRVVIDIEEVKEEVQSEEEN